MEALLTYEGLIALLTLTLLEVVLGIDNIIFISILTNKLPKAEQPKARTWGLMLAMLIRILFLFAISYLTKLVEPVFTVMEQPVSGKDLVMLAGGLFLIAKSTSEIHHKTVDSREEHMRKNNKLRGFARVIVQIVLLDIVFSLDSILTAIGLAEEIVIMVVAVVISMVIMLIFAGRISAFIQKHPTLQVLALSFLILIGFTLILEVQMFGVHVPKGYIYFAVFFSLVVEVLNIRITRKRKMAAVKS